MAKAPSSRAIIDLTKLSIDELAELVAAATAQIAKVRQGIIDDLMFQRAALDKELEKYTGKPIGSPRVGNGKKAPKAESTGGKTRSKPPVKFKDDKGNSWTGRGATPRWLTAYEAEGKMRDQFAV